MARADDLATLGLLALEEGVAWAGGALGDTEADTVAIKSATMLSSSEAVVGSCTGEFLTSS